MMEFFEEGRHRLSSVWVGDVEIRRGSRVMLLPGPGGDVMDLALAGRSARVESIEQDYEDRVYLAVTLEDDPGRELGEDRSVLGQRFFFFPEEVVPLEPEGDDDAG